MTNKIGSVKIKNLPLFFFLIFGIWLFATSAGDCYERETFTMSKISEKTVPYGAEAQVWKPLVNLAYFNTENQLRLNDMPIESPSSIGCETTAARRRIPKMLKPRVDEVLCPSNIPKQSPERKLLGFDEQGNEVWKRKLIFNTGNNLIDLYVLGATPEGIVLSNLEVWSPWTGQTIVPAITRQATPATAIPVYSLAYSAIYHPQLKEFYVFDADVTLVRRKGGLWRIRTSTGEKDLFHPVKITSLLGSFDRVVRMALSADGRYLFLAQEESNRGPTEVSLLVLDLRNKKTVFEERFCTKGNTVCRDPQVITGADGHIGFAYDMAGQYVLVHYRLFNDR